MKLLTEFYPAFESANSSLAGLIKDANPRDSSNKAKQPGSKLQLEEEMERQVANLKLIRHMKNHG